MKLICEKHPHLDWPHGSCSGPGLHRSERLGIMRHKIIQLEQEIRERDSLMGHLAMRVTELADEIEAMRALGAKPKEGA